jgi:competence protein ComEC
MALPTDPSPVPVGDTGTAHCREVNVPCMKSNLLQKVTRFRAYQLGTKGSSFSYFDGQIFTLLEARLTNLSRPRLDKEMEICGVTRVGCLHITSWDTDHCAKNEVEEILKRYKPKRIEYPGYEPKSETAKECRALILNYPTQLENESKLQTRGEVLASAVVQRVDPAYIRSLETAQALGYRDIVYGPRKFVENCNDNSTIKLFRSGCFNVASLGDAEDNFISAGLANSSIFASEVDVMILAHHGADNGFTTHRFLRATKPTIAICSSNYDNEYEHPKPEIREMLKKHGIPIYTTKTGDVAVQSKFPHTDTYRVINLKADSTEISSEAEYKSKKSKKLDNNLDTLKNLYLRKKTPYRPWKK